MHVVSALLLGVSTNLDNLFLGLSLGLQKKKLPFRANAVIGLFSAAVTALFCASSALLSGLGRLPNLVGGGIIITMGLWSLLPGKQDTGSDCYQQGFTWHETLVLGSGLAVNCIPVAFGAGLTGIPPWIAALSVGGISLLCVAAGNAIGLAATVLALHPRFFVALGSGIMIVLGILELLG